MYNSDGTVNWIETVNWCQQVAFKFQLIQQQNKQQNVDNLNKDISCYDNNYDHLCQIDPEDANLWRCLKLDKEKELNILKNK